MTCTYSPLECVSLLLLVYSSIQPWAQASPVSRQVIRQGIPGGIPLLVHSCFPDHNAFSRSSSHGAFGCRILGFPQKAIHRASPPGLYRYKVNILNVLRNEMIFCLPYEVCDCLSKSTASPAFTAKFNFLFSGVIKGRFRAWQQGRPKQ